MSKLRVVRHTDGVEYMVPEDVPDSQAPKGIPLHADFSDLYPEPFCTQLVEELVKRGALRADASDQQIMAALRATFKIKLVEIRQRLEDFENGTE